MHERSHCMRRADDCTRKCCSLEYHALLNSSLRRVKSGGDEEKRLQNRRLCEQQENSGTTMDWWRNRACGGRVEWAVFNCRCLGRLDCVYLHRLEFVLVVGVLAYCKGIASLSRESFSCSSRDMAMQVIRRTIVVLQDSKLRPTQWWYKQCFTE